METEDDHNSSSLRVASFSCYLDAAKESLVHRVSAQDNISIKFSKKEMASQEQGAIRVDSFSRLNAPSSVPGPIQDPTSAFFFSPQIPKHAVAAEIGVFGADKYFNMKLEYKTAAAKNQKPKNLAPTTPSMCSETASWNSQTTLLPNFPQNQSQMKQKKAMAARLFMGFGCRGPCFDKKSVHINAQRLDHHHLPLPPPLLAAAPAKKQQLLEESRRSIEVFGSKNRSSKGVVATNMERKLSMLTWDAIPAASTVGTSSICDDMASDASSDLFEIENISDTVYPLLESKAAAAAPPPPPADDVYSSCMSPASLYAPSEASIQWSVVTASAADYSALSEFNDDSVSVAAAAASAGKKIAAQRGLKMRNQGGAGFLGCKNHKAVDVAQNVCVKTSKD